MLFVYPRDRRSPTPRLGAPSRNQAVCQSPARQRPRLQAEERENPLHQRRFEDGRDDFEKLTAVLPVLKDVLEAPLDPLSYRRDALQRPFAGDRKWPLCKALHNGHYEKTSVMTSSGMA